MNVLRDPDFFRTVTYIGKIGWKNTRLEVALLKFVLYPVAWLFGLCVWVRNWCYDRGVFGTKSLKKPVISVGNLSMGGVGKTPLCDAIAKTLRQRGLRVAILSRGYGRTNPKQALRVDLNGSWRDFGDEPMMLALKNPDACVCVGANRVEAAKLACNFKPDVYVLDDGFQHRSLRRDLDLVVIDVSQPFPRLFPVGMFREGWRSLTRAHAVILSHCETDGDGQPFVAHIQRTVPNLPVLRFQTAAKHVIFPREKMELPVSELVGKSVGAFAGIAHPEHFFGMLRNLGANVILEHPLRDHQTLNPAALTEFLTSCEKGGATWALTTEKDWVKLEVLEDSGILLGFLPLEVQWGDPMQWNRIVENFFRDRNVE